METKRLARLQHLENYARELVTVKDPARRLRLLKLLEEELARYSPRRPELRPDINVHKRRNLAVVDLPPGQRAVSAPPVLVASIHTVDYCCGNCGTLLMHADEGQVHNLLIHCVKCGSYNSTNI